MKPKITDVIRELERELKLREKMYPEWIQSGKLNRQRAEKQYLRLKEAVRLLSEKAEAENRQGKLF